MILKWINGGGWSTRVLIWNFGSTCAFMCAYACTNMCSCPLEHECEGMIMMKYSTIKLKKDRRKSFWFSIMRNRSKRGASPCLASPALYITRRRMQRDGQKMSQSRGRPLVAVGLAKSPWECLHTQKFPWLWRGSLSGVKKEVVHQNVQFSCPIYIFPKGYMSDGIFPEDRLTALPSTLPEVHDVRPAWRVLRSLSKSHILSREWRPCDMPRSSSLPLARATRSWKLFTLGSASSCKECSGACKERWVISAFDVPFNKETRSCNSEFTELLYDNLNFRDIEKLSNWQI